MFDRSTMPAIFQSWTDKQITMMIEAAQEIANELAGAPNMEQHIMNMFQLGFTEVQWLLRQQL